MFIVNFYVYWSNISCIPLISKLYYKVTIIFIQYLINFKIVNSCYDTVY